MVGAIGSILETAPHDSVQVGLERGVVFAGDVGHPERRAWTVIGDSVNVAARLAGAARPGRALVGPELRSTIPHLFDDAAARHAAGQGSAPAGVRRGVRPAPTAAPAIRRSSPASVFVGRDAELAALSEAWADAGRGRGRAIEVVAEAGMGKTRLLAELRRAATAGGAGPDQITDVVPDLYRASAPYATAARLLRAVAGIPEDASADRAGARPTGLGRRDRPAPSRVAPPRGPSGRRPGRAHARSRPARRRVPPRAQPRRDRAAARRGPDPAVAPRGGGPAPRRRGHPGAARRRRPSHRGSPVAGVHQCGR